MTEPDESLPEERDEQLPDGPLPAATRIAKSSGGRASVLGAAMIAVGEVLEPHKTDVEMEQPADAADDDSGLDLSFGDLPPIDEL